MVGHQNRRPAGRALVEAGERSAGEDSLRRCLASNWIALRPPYQIAAWLGLAAAVAGRDAATFDEAMAAAERLLASDGRFEPDYERMAALAPALRMSPLNPM